MNILFLEYNYFHDEVIIPQIDLIYRFFLKKDNINNIYLIINENVKRRETFDLSMYEGLVNNIYVNFIKKRYGRIIKYINILYVIDTLFFVYKNKIDVIVFNTIDSYNEDIELLLKFLPKKIKKIGVLHNGDKIDLYFDKYDRIIVLSELVANSLNKKKVEYLYTLLYKYKNTISIRNKKGLTVCIPGNIEMSRRDYKYIIEFVSKYKEFCRSNQIVFKLLGNINSQDGLKIKKMIEKKGITSFFHLFEQFIGYNQFMGNIVNSDIIMPLIHENIKNFSAYQKTKISDAFNMAYSCNKPLLMHKIFESKKEFKDFCFFYKDDLSLKKILKVLATNKELIKEKSILIKNAKKFSYESQAEKYLKILTLSK